MTARSVLLSVLLGAHPAHATAAELVKLVADFGIREATVRVALTRLVAAGDLVRDDDGYRLSDRLLARQRRQDDALAPRVRPWDGGWLVLVITAVGNAPRDRAALRTGLQQLRYGELREGVWLRPDNLVGTLPPAVDHQVRMLRATDDRPHELAARLWDLQGWAATGRELLAAMSAADMPARFVTAAAIVRHVVTDPVLPDALLPPAWPGAELRRAYAEFAAELAARRHQIELTKGVT
ncbi:PaaX domain-containing protein, C- domain protein [Mycobacterium sp. MYCO198283]|uniref:PaaX family transcriptional regulator C-terminal domain-containing protein n=1 Tax=Mycobacterium sp. MYCO198283 TaxID=2883505 RepID=UPI001E60CBFE|nr:PaaX family transcriptional regulator C-terminal domain-containing protein [Mycobacterium sp. MYCO198283]MCG5431899.1 PaaX domain-containing protein, C- domain protein [Mycobacterium sp. MYCO198283]